MKRKVPARSVGIHKEILEFQRKSANQNPEKEKDLGRVIGGSKGVQGRSNRNFLWEGKERKEEDGSTRTPLYNWRLTLKLVRSTDRLHPAGREGEGGM